MNTRDIFVIMLYEFKLRHSPAVATRNINEAFGHGTANERTIQRCFAKFRSCDMSLENEPRGRPEAVVNNEGLNITARRQKIRSEV